MCQKSKHQENRGCIAEMEQGHVLFYHAHLTTLSTTTIPTQLQDTNEATKKHNSTNIIGTSFFI